MDFDILLFVKEVFLLLKANFVPVIIAAGSFFLGFFIEKITGRYIKRFVAKTAWKGDDIVVAAMHGKTKYIFLLLSLFIAVRYSPASTRQIEAFYKGLTITIIIFITFMVIKIANLFFTYERAQQNGSRPINSIIQTITKITILTIGILIALQFMGISIAPILTALGVTGLAVALALQETLSNIFAGIYIIATKQIVVGNYIQLETNMEGYVRDITWRHTTVETIAHNMVVVPNSKLASSVVINYSMPRQDMNLLLKIGVSYKSDLSFVEKVTIAAASQVVKGHVGAVSDVEPVVRFHTFDDFSINFTLVVRITEFSEKYQIQHELVKQVHEAYKREGIEIPFPIRTVYLQEQEHQQK